MSVNAQQQTGTNPSQQTSHANTWIKLDCRITGYPTPWVQWYRNGKLLRNKQGRLNIRTSKWARRRDVQLSRLEIKLRPGKNETGIYECRAMNVAAREPVVGTYTLLVLPAHYALIPMQPPEPLSHEFDQVASTQAASPVHSPAPAHTPAPSSTRRHQQATTTTTTTMSRPAAQTTAPTTTTTTTTSTTTRRPTASSSAKTIGPNRGPPPGSPSNSIQEPATRTPVVGQRCPAEANDNFCLNKGTCVLIEHIGEYFCK